MHRLPGIVFLLLIFASPLKAQEATSARPDPKVAFLKSLAIPGWGHYDMDHSDWNRGKYHLAAEAGFILSYLGLSVHSNNIRHNWLSYGSAEAGVSLANRSRDFRLAVGNFNSLQAYNDYQKRSRNWDNLYEERPENRWQWPENEARQKYSILRNRFENIEQQLPALLGLMVVNRIVSGISAYNRARKASSESNISDNIIYLSPASYGSGIIANMKVPF